MTDNLRFKEFDHLVDLLCAEIISEDEFAQLQSTLAESAEHRQRFQKLVGVHASLHEGFDSGLLLEDEPEPAPAPVIVPVTEPTPKPDLLPVRMIVGLAACSTVIALIAVAIVLTSENRIRTAARPLDVFVQPLVNGDNDALPVAATPESQNAIPSLVRRTQQGIAVVQSLANPTWSEGTLSKRTGDVLKPGTLGVDSGVVEIVFLSGVVAVVEGPAELELLAANRAVLHSGSVRCSVPPGVTGFEIESADTRYVDIGTDFGLVVGKDGRQELHVFDGKVEVHPVATEDKPRLISSGEGLVIGEEDGVWKSIPSDAERFTTADVLQERRRVQQIERHKVWLEHIAKLRLRDDLKVLYDFQRDDSHPRTLFNIADDSAHGAIIGCQWTRGRWNRKGALEFKRPSDRVRVNIPGEFENLTLAVWLRVDGFDRSFSSILLTDKFDQGDVHWQIKSTGQMDIGVKVEPEVRQAIYVTPRAFNYEDLGQWVHLAVVVDQNRNILTHYLNGEIFDAQELNLADNGAEPDQNVKITFGNADIGNWSPLRPYDGFLTRNFNGRMDELAIFGRALNGDEITAIYEAGTPLLVIPEDTLPVR